MPGPAPLLIILSQPQQETLERIVRRHSSEQRLVRRAQIVLKANAGLSNVQIAQALGIDRETVQCWRQRWYEAAERLSILEAEGIADQELTQHIQAILTDQPRPGAPATFSAQQVVRIVALACEDPQESGLPITEWTPRELAQEAINRGIVERISARSVERFLDEAKLQPHRSRYWLNAEPEDPEVFNQQVQDVCNLYQQAPELFNEGTHVISTDEMTGIPAWERAHDDHPMKPGKIKLQEFEYIRHGGCCLIANWHVALGQVIVPSLLPTRKEFDFANHTACTIETAPQANWVFIVDQLNTHKSASLVRLVTACCELDIDLGVKGSSGILKSMANAG